MSCFAGRARPFRKCVIKSELYSVCSRRVQAWFSNGTHGVLTFSDNYSYLRNQPRQQRSIDRFHHILDTANQLFAEVGYENVTTNHLAEAAGVAVGSVYHFFPNKETVLRALVERYEKQLVVVFPVDVAPPRPLLDVLDEMLDNVMAFMAAKSGLEWMLDKVEMPGR